MLTSSNPRFPLIFPRLTSNPQIFDTFGRMTLTINKLCLHIEFIAHFCKIQWHFAMGWTFFYRICLTFRSKTDVRMKYGQNKNRTHVMMKG